MGDQDQVLRKFRAATQRTARTEGAAAELLGGDFVWTLHRPFKAPKPQDLPREAAPFPLDVRAACSEPHIAGRIDQSLLVSLSPASRPRVYDPPEPDDVLSSVCLYAFLIVSIWDGLSL